MAATKDKQRRGFYNSDEPRAPTPGPDAAVLQVLAECSIIAAVNSPDTFDEALASPTRAIYLLTGTPLSLPKMLERARSLGKVCLVNIDFLEGLSRDRHAVEFIAAHKVDGIVSTRFETLKAAHAVGLYTVQRTFGIDSAAVSAALRSLSQFVPDAMEVLPAMAAPKVARRLLQAHPGLTLIGGGLIENVSEIEALLAAGIHSVSVSDPRLWLI
jgi:glycerol uptake operon antiterminator